MVSFYAKAISLIFAISLGISTFICKFCIMHSSQRCPCNEMSPIILIPGYAASTFEAKLNKSATVYPFCYKKTNEYFTLWLDYKLLLPGCIYCWIDNMKLIYNNETKTTSNAPGVDIRFPGFGKSDTLDFYSEIYKIIPYFKPITMKLYSLNYKNGINLAGAPYDWRKSPHELDDYYKQLKKLTEELSNKNNAPVSYICHSMGCVVLLYFLNHQPQYWKNHYVRRIISISGAYGGTVKSLKTIISGDDFAIPYIFPSNILEQQRTCMSLFQMVPSEEIWEKDKALVENPLSKKIYTLKNLQTLFNDMNASYLWNIYKDVRDKTKNFDPPNTEIHCLYGQNISTIDKLIYDGEFSNDKFTSIYGNGDGTINLESLKICSTFLNKQSKPVYFRVYNNLDHSKILNDKRVLSYITKVLKQQ